MGRECAWFNGPRIICTLRVGCASLELWLAAGGTANQSEDGMEIPKQSGDVRMAQAHLGWDMHYETACGR